MSIYSYSDALRRVCLTFEEVSSFISVPVLFTVDVGIGFMVVLVVNVTRGFFRLSLYASDCSFCTVGERVTCVVGAVLALSYQVVVTDGRVSGVGPREV